MSLVGGFRWCRSFCWRRRRHQRLYGNPYPCAGLLLSEARAVCDHSSISEEPTKKTYYFGIPLDYAHDYNVMTLMFAFVYCKREVSASVESGTRELTVERNCTRPNFKSEAMGGFLKKIPPTMTTGLDLMTRTSDDCSEVEGAKNWEQKRQVLAACNAGWQV